MTADFEVNFSRVLVTGASGFIGSRLIQRLSEVLATSNKTSGNSFEIIALVRQKRTSDGNIKLPAGYGEKLEGVEVVYGDLTDPSSMKFGRDSVEGNSKFDAVFHLAAATPDTRTSREKLRKVNLEGTKNLFGAVRDNVQHFIYVSGLAVFSPQGEKGSDANAPSNMIFNEGSPKSPRLDYVKLRLEAEEYLRENCAKRGIDFTVVYFPDIVYGNGGSFRSIFLEKIKNGKFRIPGSGDYYTNFMHLDDAVNTLITVAAKRTQTANESFIASDSNPSPFKNFINFIADEMGVKHPGTAPLFLAKAVVGSDLIKMLTKDTRASNQKISELYRFQYPSYTEGIPGVVSQFLSGA